MRKMKPSGVEWIGDIPQEWEIALIKYSIKWKSEKGKPDATVLSLYRDYGIVPKDSRDDNHNVTSLDTSGYKVVDIGDFVINKMKAWQGSMAISSYKGRVSPAYHVCEITDDKVYRNYFHYLLRSDLYITEYTRLSKGMRIGQWDLDFHDFKNLPFLIPPISEQQRIAEFLDRKCAEIDSIIAKTKATIEQYKALKQSVITQAVTKGIRPDRPMKDSGIEWIGEIPQEWEVKSAFQIFKQVKNLNTNLVETNLLSLSYGKIKRKNIDTLGGLLPENFEGYNIITANDIVLRLTDLQNDHTSLRVGLATETGIVTSAYLSLRNISENLPVYLYYFLHSFDVCKGFYGMGAGIRQGLNWNGIKMLKIVIPSLSEQQEIADYLDEKCDVIDELIRKKEQLLTELESYKKSVIYEYVTGKKEIAHVENSSNIVVFQPSFPAQIISEMSKREIQSVLMAKILDMCSTNIGRIKLKSRLAHST